MSTFYDIFALQETWLDDAVADSEIIRNTDFAIYRKDRRESANRRLRGGGVILLTDRMCCNKTIRHEGVPIAPVESI